MNRYFLIQISSKGYDSLILHNQYINQKWRHKDRDSALGRVSVGDIIIVYFTSKVPSPQKQVRYIYRVTEIRKNLGILNLIPLYEIKKLTRQDIINEVERGNLSKKMMNCGRQGFNIIELPEKDYYEIISRGKKDTTIGEIKKQYASAKGTTTFSEDMILELEMVSNINLLFYYSNSLADMPSSVKRKLLGLRLVKKVSKNDHHKLVITERGRSLLKNQV